MIVSTFQYSIFRFAFRLLCDEEEARDIAQDTFLKVWINIRSYDPKYKFTTWIYKITSNLCYDRLRMLKKKLLRLEGEINNSAADKISSCNVEFILINSELAGFIVRFTQDLTPRQKLVFTLRDIEGFEVDEVTRITGLPAAKIKSNLYLARKCIRGKIEKIS